MIKKYNKLIRDKIPEIIKEAGWVPTVRILRKSEFLNALKKKVFEEAEELIQTRDRKEIIDEIVDIQELLDVLAAEIKLTKSEIKKLQIAKRKNAAASKSVYF